MKIQQYGYVRVSTKDQNEDRQIIAMKTFGIPKANIFIEKLSGKDFNRPVYKNMLDNLSPGDAVVIKSLDRLGRDYNEVIDQWRHITRDLGADIVVIDMPLLDTRKKDRDLTTSFVADIVLQILSYVAETERQFNKQRQAEGIAAAKARGIKFGSQPLPRPKNLAQIRTQWQSGQISSRTAGHLLGISHTTFLNWVKEKPLIPVES